MLMFSKNIGYKNGLYSLLRERERERERAGRVERDPLLQPTEYEGSQAGINLNEPQTGVSFLNDGRLQQFFRENTLELNSKLTWGGGGRHLSSGSVLRVVIL